MTRRIAREIAVRMCFGLSENPRPASEYLDEMFDRDYYETLKEEDELYGEYPDERQREYIERVVLGVGAHSAELDEYIEKYSKGWAFSRISRTALAVMKTAMFEIMYIPEIPDGAAINEAVELSKKYDEPETVKFINGVLGSFVRNEIPQ